MKTLKVFARSIPTTPRIALKKMKLYFCFHILKALTRSCLQEAWIGVERHSRDGSIVIVDSVEQFFG